MLSSDLGRLGHITRILGKYGFAGFLRGKSETGQEDAAGEKIVAVPSGPRRFRLMLEELGPTFIKFGQVLSSRPDLVAAEYIEELKLLQTSCEPLPFRAIEEAIADGLKAEPAQLFQHIDSQPLATASIAQVHRGRTHDGDEVVIKVQRPNIAAEIRGDIDILFRVARFLDVVLEEANMTDSTGVVREFEKALFEELNFQHEADNLTEFGRLHEQRSDIVIPKVYPNLTSPTVLTMSYLAGQPLSRLPKDIDRKKIAERIVVEAFDEVFIDGVYHADPHPGNVMLLDDGRYGILDCGLLGRLTPQMRETLIVLALAITVRDADTAARTLYSLGRPDARVSLSAVRNDVELMFNKYLGHSFDQVNTTAMLQELMSLAMKHKMRVSPEYTMLIRAGATIEGMVREFHPQIQIGEVAKPYAERLLVGRVAPDQWEGSLYKGLLQFQGLSRDLPIQMSQILADFASGNFAVHVAGAQMEKLSNTISLAAATVAGAIVGGAFVIGSFIGLSRMDWQFFGVPLVGVLGAVIGASAFIAVSLYVLLRPRIKRFSLVKFLGRRR